MNKAGFGLVIWAFLTSQKVNLLLVFFLSQIAETLKGDTGGLLPACREVLPYS